MQVPSIFKPLFNHEYDTYRVLVYYGGRGGGKSYAIALFLVLECLKKPISVWVAREIDKSKKTSIVEQFKVTLKDLGITDYAQVTQTEIRFTNGAKIIFEGVSEVTINNLKSAVGISYFWFEEAQGLSQNLVSTLIPSIRGENSQIIISLNPQKSTDYIYREFILAKENDYSKAIKVNYYDNPFFPEVLDKDRLRNLETMPRDMYMHIWEGETNDYNDMQVIDISKISPYDTTLKWSYEHIILSIDTATSTRTGADYSVVSVLGKVRDSKECHIIHLARGRYDWHTLLQTIQSVLDIARIITGRSGVNCILVEAKANGLNVIQELQRLTHLNVRGVTPKTDKLTRVVNDLLPYIDNLKIPLDSTNPYNFWVSDFLSECKLFRADGKHEHDDQIDSVSQGLNFLYNNALDFETIRKALM